MLLGSLHDSMGEGTTALEDRLRSISSQFKQGARISIYFSIGLALTLKGEDSNYCIRFERDYGYGTSIADANHDFEKLQKLFMFFKEKKDTKECINWGLVNIASFGRWDKKDEKIFLPYPQNYATYEGVPAGIFETYKWDWRNFTKREREFISHKVNEKNYCQEMTHPEYYYSDVYRLLNNIEDGETDSSILII